MTKPEIDPKDYILVCDVCDGEGNFPVLSLRYHEVSLSKIKATCPNCNGSRYFNWKPRVDYLKARISLANILCFTFGSTVLSIFPVFFLVEASVVYIYILAILVLLLFTALAYRYGWDSELTKIMANIEEVAKKSTTLRKKEKEEENRW